MEKKRAKFNRKILAISSLLMLIASGVFIFVFLSLYSVSKENILSKWSNDTLQFSQQVAHYIKMPMDAVAFSGVKLNEMLARNGNHKEAAEYLVNETAIYSSVIKENNTGVYSYYRGEYLDGSGWICPNDYKPKERPWYTAAVKGNGEIVLVEPFLNLQTFTMMMSVSQLLNDRESVVSMDIFLDSVQKACEDAAAKAPVNAAIVMDKNGFIVAHSEKLEVGKNFSTEGTPFQKKILSIIQKAETSGTESTEFQLRNDKKKYTVFTEEINDNWSSVFILNDSELYKSLKSIYFNLGIVLIFVMISFLVVFFRISKKYAEAEQLSREIRAVADIYETVLKIDLINNSIECIRNRYSINVLLAFSGSGFSSQAQNFAETMSAEQSREILKNFMQVETLEDRLKGINSISQEFMDKNNRWIRARFVKVDEDENGKLYHLLLAFESIDEDRKRQEKLKKLSETDMMTGIRNRGSGEILVRKAMAEGQTGMFCLMDADKFKSINDNYGHSVGDKVIIAIADALKKTFRDSDVIFRLGGDEFAVFSEGVITEEIGKKIMERFFANISIISIPELNGRKIEISAGASFYPAVKEDSFESLYQRADSGTYESKKVSGNYVTFKN